MPIHLFNTSSRAEEEFVPLDPAAKQVKMYTCGPTVYNYAHIGNFRAYLFEDLLQRHLEFRGYTVERVMNLTDVDDKTIRGARMAGEPLPTFTQRYKDSFFEDLDVLRIKRASAFPAATEPRYIAKMIAMIATLLESGHAYQAEDRSLYFRLSTFPNYGKLAHLNLEELRPSGRVQSDDYDKEHIGDFALWKAWDEADGEVAWESPWGRGRPGWHIECSAMATELLGPQIDIHCGGVDNIFPHHEAEIAQSECCTGQTFVRYWLHCAHLMVEGQKMAKSLGNFYTLRDLLAKGWTGREVRYALLSVHYRLPLNFTFEGLNASRSALGRIAEWVARLAAHATGPALPYAVETQTAFEQALDEDLNISAALGHLFDVIHESNRAFDKGELKSGEARALLDWWERINAILAIEPDAVPVPDEVVRLAQARSQARADKNWTQSDKLREQIAALGWQLKDTKDGAKLSPAPRSEPAGA